jgi:hypothetical protein
VVTYAEIRRWARWLGVFTASELAGALRTTPEIGERGVTALLYHECCEDTGEVVDGPLGPEKIVAYIPLPPGPKEHPHETPPEITAVREMGGLELFNRRGLPVSMSNGRVRQSTPGRWRPTRIQGRKKKVEEN